MLSSKIKDDETLCVPKEEETLEVEADYIDNKIWVLGFNGGDYRVNNDTKDLDLVDNSNFKEVKGIAGKV